MLKRKFCTEKSAGIDEDQATDGLDSSEGFTHYGLKRQIPENRIVSRLLHRLSNRMIMIAKTISFGRKFRQKIQYGLMRLLIRTANSFHNCRVCK